MLQLYSADVCPFAQRVRALLTHLKVGFEQHVVDLNDRDPEFLKLTPTGKVPLLVDGKVKLYESAVICQYLAEQHGFADAFDEKLENRARERLAMVTWDATIAPSFYRGLKERGLDADTQKAVQAELKELAQTVQATGKKVGNLLSFHVAPHWARMTWLRDLSPTADLIGEWIDVKSWLDRCVEQPAIQATLPAKEATIARYREKFGSA